MIYNVDEGESQWRERQGYGKREGGSFMRMLKRATILLGLIAVLATGIVFLRLSATLQQDEAVLEWSNSLVTKAISIASTPRFVSQAIKEKLGPNAWLISGEIAFPDSGGGELRDWYVAVVRQVCDVRRDASCWVLQSLVLGREGPVAAAAVAGAVEDASSSATGSVDETLGQSPAQVPAVTAPTSPGGITVEIRPPVDTTTADEQSIKDANGGGTTLETSAGPATVPNSESTQTLSATAESRASRDRTLTAAPETARNRDTGSSLVFLIQDRLNRLGYGSPSGLPLDGYLGPETREAILAYQSVNSLQIDGRPSETLLRHIEGKIRRPASAN